MPPRDALFLALTELKRRTDGGVLDQLYPEAGPKRRELYWRHTRMFAKGAEHTERVCLGGNRIGKSLGIGGYELAVHLTGLYPRWWEGRRFEGPIMAWACGTKSVKTRDINQFQLLGKLRRTGAVTTATVGGLIPPRLIQRITRKSGVADAVDTAFIQHVDGHENRLMFKSYEEGRTAFEGEAAHFIWLDEEPTKPIYDECMMRLLTTDGSIIVTLTPVEGMTEVVMSLLEGSEFL